MGLADAVNRPGEKFRLQASRGARHAAAPSAEVKSGGSISLSSRGVRTSLDRRDVFAIAVLGLIGVGIPLWLAAAAGAIGIPTIDDWVYMRGPLTCLTPAPSTCPDTRRQSIGQLLMVQPLLELSGGDPWAFTAFGLIMTSIGIVATYLLARRFVGTGSRRWLSCWSWLSGVRSRIGELHDRCARLRARTAYPAPRHHFARGRKAVDASSLLLAWGSLRSASANSPSPPRPRSVHAYAGFEARRRIALGSLPLRRCLPWGRQGPFLASLIPRTSRATDAGGLGRSSSSDRPS